MSDLETIAIDQLATSYQTLRLAQPQIARALGESVRDHGFLSPLVGHRVDEGVEIIDGFKRLRVAHELGVEQMSVRVLDVDAVTAIASIAVFNAPHRGLSSVEEGWLVHRLVREHGLAQRQVAELLGRARSWVSRRLQLVEGVVESVLDDIKLGLLAPTVARSVARLPRGNQAEVVQAVREHGLATRQVAALVERMLHTDDRHARRALLDDPVAFLGTPRPREPVRDPRLGERGERLRRRIRALHTAALAFEEDAVLADREHLALGECAVLAGQAVSCLLPLTRALATMREWAEEAPDDVQT